MYIVARTPLPTSMNGLPLLTEVAQELQQDASLGRIRKLLYFLRHQRWEPNNDKLNDLDLPTLIQEIRTQNPTLDQLRNSLSEAIQRINKRAEYTRVARLIITQFQKLYQADHIATSASSRSTAAPATQAASDSAWQEFQLVDYEPFDLRVNIMRQTNPLRAKLLLFTAMNYPLDLTERGLSTLKRHTLNSLLKTLLDTATTPMELEHKLRQAASKLEDREQTSQTMSALLQYLKPLYVCVPPQAASPSVVVAEGGLAPAVEDAHTPETLSWLEDPEADFSNSTTVEDTLPYRRSHHSQLTSQPAPQPQPAPRPQPATPPQGGLGYVPDDWMDGQLQPVAAPTPVSVPAPVPVVAAPRSMDLKLGKLLQPMVDKNTADLMVTIENTLSELGNYLDERLQDEDPSNYLQLKHQVLRAFLKDIEGFSPSFFPMLRKLEESEWMLIQPDQPLPTNDDEETWGIGQDPYLTVRKLLASHPIVLQNPAYDEDIKRLVRRSMTTIKTGIEGTITALGNELDESLTDVSLSDGLSMKYKSLRVFVHGIAEVSTKFNMMLSKMEEAERRLFNL